MTFTKHLLSAVAAAALLAACAGPQSMSNDHIEAIVAAPDRAEADRINDTWRKPAETLAFIGVRPGNVALDVSAARGYTTELLARAVGPAGKVYGQNRPRAESAPARPPVQPEGGAAPAARTPAPTLAERASKPGFSNIVAVMRPFDDPVPPEVAVGGLDVVTLMFNYHDFGHMDIDRAKMNASIYRALKSGGVYVIADHSGRPDTGISEAGTLHRVEENYVVKEVEAAGFKLSAVGNFMRNPEDPRDKNTPDPAMPKDEFILRFVKPE